MNKNSVRDLGRASLDLHAVVDDFAQGIHEIDQLEPVWTSARTGSSYQAGIGPHPETETVRLVMERLHETKPERYPCFALGVAYPGQSRQKCDLTINDPPWWAIEIKMFRLMGDNGKPNDNMLMHILSPYPVHRSALTDVEKLRASTFNCRQAILIYGFDYPGLPMEPAIAAFEKLADTDGSLSGRVEAHFQDLVHPIHKQGRVVAWEVLQACASFH